MHTTPTQTCPPRDCRPPEMARGLVLPLSLIVLVLLLFSSFALMRSVQSSLSMAGNLAFKRDLANQGERGMATAITQFTATSGALYSATTRKNNLYAANYSAVELSSNAHGIPLVLINDTTFSSLGLGASDITDDTTGVRIRYVVDRLCNATGAFSSTGCVSINIAKSRGGSSSKLKDNSASNQPVYRISVRVTGPRNTQAYFQTTITD